MSVKSLVGGVGVALICLGTVAVAQTAMVTKLPADIQLKAIPFAPGGEAGWVYGDGKTSEMYTFRVHLAKGAKIPPHTHPDTRMTTVLSGELFIGTDPNDPSKGTLLPAGSFTLTPANAVHWSWAKNSDTVYQETGNGPTATNLLKP